MRESGAGAAGTTQGTALSPIRRVEHAFVIALFLVLLLTGLAQKLHAMDWARWVLDAMGGPHAARTLHRAVGLIFTAHLVLHVLTFAVGVSTGRMRASLVPGRGDLRHARNNLLHYLGRREAPPARLGFDLGQKLGYLAMLLGGLALAASGLILMYPIPVASLLPAELIPAARVAHVEGGMTALVVLVIWHGYANHLSPRRRRRRR